MIFYYVQVYKVRDRVGTAVRHYIIWHELERGGGGGGVQLQAVVVRDESRLHGKYITQPHFGEIYMHAIYVCDQ